MNRLAVFALGFCLFGSEPAGTRLGKRVLILENGPWAETMTVVDAGPSLLVIDTFASPAAAAGARSRAEAFFLKPVSHVINTHHHWDHTFGNQAFSDAVIIGHEYCAADMKAEYSTPESRLRALGRARAGAENESLRTYFRKIEDEIRNGFHLMPPTQLVGDREELRIGNLAVVLYHAPGLHTRSNLTVFIPDLGLVFTRREFCRDALPALEAGADLPKLIAGLEDIVSRGKPVETIIPGHGKPLSNPGLQAALDYLGRLEKVVREAHASGKTLEDAERSGPFKPFPLLERFPDRHRANLVILGDQK